MLRAPIKIHVLDNGLSHPDGILLLPHRQVNGWERGGGAAAFALVDERAMGP